MNKDGETYHPVIVDGCSTKPAAQCWPSKLGLLVGVYDMSDDLLTHVPDPSRAVLTCRYQTAATTSNKIM